MKAWTDITREHTVWETSEGEYFINMGVKIERLHDGAFRIYNANTNNFKEVSKEHYELFENKGFIYGAYFVTIDQFVKDLRSAKYNLERRKRIIAKYLQFKNKYINFVQI